MLVTSFSFAALIRPKSKYLLKHIRRNISSKSPVSKDFEIFGIMPKLEDRIISPEYYLFFLGLLVIKFIFPLKILFIKRENIRKILPIPDFLIIGSHLHGAKYILTKASFCINIRSFGDRLPTCITAQL